MPADFAHQFCAHCDITPARYAHTALARALYPHARLLRPLIELADSTFFAADRQFVLEAGQARSHRDFAFAAEEFYEHPANDRWLRRVLRLRVSTARLQLLFLLSREAPPSAATI